MQSLIRSLGKVREGHSHHWRVQGRAPPPHLFLDETEARRAEKTSLETAPAPHLSKGLDDRGPHSPPPPSSQGLDPALVMM